MAWRNLIGPTKYGTGEGKDFKRKSEEIKAGSIYDYFVKFCNF